MELAPIQIFVVLNMAGVTLLQRIVQTTVGLDSKGLALILRIAVHNLVIGKLSEEK